MTVTRLALFDLRLTRCLSVRCVSSAWARICVHVRDVRANLFVHAWARALYAWARALRARVEVHHAGTSHENWHAQSHVRVRGSVRASACVRLRTRVQRFS
jgi:hypothetical protein